MLAILPLASLLAVSPAQQTSEPTAYLGATELVTDAALDGTRLALGRPSAEEVEIYERDSVGVWSSVAVIPEPSPGMEDFGSSVALDGDRLLVGAPGKGDPAPNPSFPHGAAVLFERQPDGTWLDVFTWSAGPSQFGGFGEAVALEGDRLAVGSPADKGSILFPGDGLLQIRDRQPDGTWTLSAQLTGPNNSDLGQAIALDGDRAVATDPRSTSARVYERSAAGVWEWVETLQGPPEASIHWGDHVALEGDLIAVESREFEVHVFERQPSGDWIQTAALGATGGDSIFTSFADDVAIHNGSIYASGSDEKLGPGGVIQRHLTFVERFDRDSEGDWTATTKFEPLVPPVSSPSDHLIAIDGTTMIVGDEPVELGSNAVEFRTTDFLSSTDALSLAAGGTQTLNLWPGLTHAGRIHLVLGSAAGTEPGIPIGSGWTLPLVADGYFNFLLTNPGAPLVGGVGIFDQNGRATASIQVAAGTDPALAGTTLWHAYASLEATTGFSRRASQPVAIELLP